MTDISAVITGHREGILAGATLNTFRAAVEHARAEGLRIEPLIVLDRADQTTTDVLGTGAAWGCRVLTTDFGDQGLVRNRAVCEASGTYMAFLDADDHWSHNWLTVGFGTCEAQPGTVIAHPHVNWFFGGFNHVFFHADQAQSDFEPAYLRLANYWDALCMAPRAVHLEHPYCLRDVAGGFAYEDWHWNMETVAAGYLHRVAPRTIHFKRRREDSQTVRASAAKVLTRHSPLLDYGWDGYSPSG